MTTPQDQPVPFRAGRAELPQGLAERAAQPAFPASVVLLADCSEFQPDIADAAYLRWSKAIVIRALYGTRVDKAWYGGARRDALHAGGARFIGIYAYIRGDQDVTAQAKALISLLGKLRPGEKLIADIEEGTGSQQARWVTWAKTVHAALGDPPWDYSGEFFARDHGLQPVTWVASYGTNEPSVPHQLWQFTDAYAVPGVGVCDCSVYHGSVDDLAALAYQGAKPPPAKFHGEWVSKGQLSLAQLAAKLGVTPAALLRMTAVHYKVFGPELAGYVNSVHNGTLRVSAPLPAGTKVWVD